MATPFRNFKADQKILLQLASGDVIDGEFVHSSSSKLTLKNCLDTNTNTRSTGFQHFFTNEIANVKAFDLPVSPHEQPTVNGGDGIIKISEHTYKELKNLSEDYIYMAIRDSRYEKAFQHLSSCETIAVAILGTDVGRCAPIDLLVISSWDQVYVFDLLLYNVKQLPRELKFLLETADITKVVHDSRGLVDSMHHLYEIRVNNIFDTYVASNMITGDHLALNECLTRFFNFPDALIINAIKPESKSIWNTRPLDNAYKQYAAKNVLYLIFLKNFLQAEMLKEFHAKVEKHSRSTLEFSPLDASIALGKLSLQN